MYALSTVSDTGTLKCPIISGVKAGDSFGDRLRMVVEELRRRHAASSGGKELSYNEIERRVGISMGKGRKSSGYLYRVMTSTKGKQPRSVPSVDNAVIIAERLGCSLLYLALGRGPMFQDDRPWQHATLRDVVDGGDWGVLTISYAKSLDMLWPTDREHDEWAAELMAFESANESLLNTG